MAELQITPTDAPGKQVIETQAAGVGILLQIMMLVLSFVLGHVLRRHKFYYLHEASASLLIANLTQNRMIGKAWFAPKVYHKVRIQGGANSKQCIRSGETCKGGLMPTWYAGT
ncbi:hypothetical protein KI387_004242 [Taxus chinensis]|uniref:Uncharacterized protein n=1 Tax=Taxus chinensis TaxID=29808 RepID=A0AA38LH19_TAXCH|nr:hypothetical protein KI387_004242 [Taxus chinensis]